MNVLDLFSGIGGFSLGLERAGMRTVAFCEINPFCQRVLAKHWPTVPCYDDIRTLTAERLAANAATGDIQIDVICGGFPCQDVSFAGRRAGLDGERSGLWFEYARLVSEIRPKIIIVENTPGLLSLGMGTVLGAWPRSGMMQNGTAYQLGPLVQITSGIASGSLLGPVRRVLPTLTVNGNYNVKGMSKTSGDGLATVLRRILPTLVAHDYRGGAKPESVERKQLDTARGLDLPSSLRMIFPESTGIINPCWAEGYMGFPIGWTELKPSATPSSPKSRKSSVAPSLLPKIIPPPVK